MRLSSVSHMVEIVARSEFGEEILTSQADSEVSYDSRLASLPGPVRRGKEAEI